MLYVRLHTNQDVLVTKAKVSWAQNEIGTFEVTVLRRDLTVSPDSLRYLDIKLIKSGETIISGTVYDFDNEIDEGGVLYYTLLCYDELGRLSYEKARSDGHYQEQTLVFIITDLLNSVTGWELGDTSTMVDIDATTTGDLRSKETLFAQVIGAVELVPNVFIRYGGINIVTGNHRVDIGQFNDLSAVRIMQDQNLVDKVSLERKVDKIYREIEAYGGRSGSDPVTLLNALNYEPSLATHFLYPIVQDANGFYVVRNTAVANGCSVVKDYEVNKTENENPPTQEELDQAGFALYLSAVADFEANRPVNNYVASAIFPRSMFGVNHRPIISQRIPTRAKVVEQAYNFSNGLLQDVTTFSINTDLKAVKIDLTFDDGAEIYELALTEGQYRQEDSSVVQLYERLERYDKKDNTASFRSGDVVTIPLFFGVGTASDSTQPLGGLSSKIYTFPLPAVPAGRTQVSFTLSVPAGYAAEQVIAPDITTGTGLTVYVAQTPGGWTVASSALVLCTFIFY